MLQDRRKMRKKVLDPTSSEFSSLIITSLKTHQLNTAPNMSAAVCVCSIFNGMSAKCIQQLTQVADLTLISQMGLSSQLHVIMFDK